jgi:hypothetical protein
MKNMRLLAIQSHDIVPSLESAETNLTVLNLILDPSLLFNLVIRFEESLVIFQNDLAV